MRLLHTPHIIMYTSHGTALNIKRKSNEPQHLIMSVHMNYLSTYIMTLFLCSVIISLTTKQNDILISLFYLL